MSPSSPRAFSLRNVKVAYASQKGGAKRRGIEWQFTFETWLAWWGDDLPRRGTRPLDLQMQRKADRGPYAPWNVTKGTPKDNGRTRGAMMQGRKWTKIASDNIAAMSDVVVDDSPDDRPEPDELGYETLWQRYG